MQVVPNLQNSLEGGSGREVPNLQNSCGPGFAKCWRRILWCGKELAASVTSGLSCFSVVKRELTIDPYTNG